MCFLQYFRDHYLWIFCIYHVLHLFILELIPWKCRRVHWCGLSKSLFLLWFSFGILMPSNRIGLTLETEVCICLSNIFTNKVSLLYIFSKQNCSFFPLETVHVCYKNMGPNITNLKIHSVLDIVPDPKTQRRRQPIPSPFT